MFSSLLPKKPQQRLKDALRNGDFKQLHQAIKKADLTAEFHLYHRQIERCACVHAVELGFSEGLRLLIEAGAPLPAHTPEGKLLINIAIAHSDTALALLTELLKGAADPNIEQGSPFFACTEVLDDNRCLLLLNRLMQYGGDINCSDAEGRSPLERLLIAERTQVAVPLVSSGAELPANLDQLPCSDELKTLVRRKQQDLQIQRQFMNH